MIEAAVLAAFASFWATQWWKTTLPWPLQPWTKAIISLGFALLGVWMLGLREGDAAIAGFAAAGMAALVHRVHRWFGATGDEARVAVITRTGNRPRM